jgi:peptidoglycan/LPS O-acetylase OafA/YrhL
MLYYCVIPILAFVLSCLRRAWHAVVITLVFAIYVHYFSAIENNFGWIWDFNNIVNYFHIFFLGTLIGYIYKRYEDFHLDKIVKRFQVINFLLGIICFAMFCVGLRLGHNFKLNFFGHSRFWAICLLCLLCSAPNFFTKWMGNSHVMREFGKCSFGIYLFHVMALKIVGKFQLLGFYRFKNGTDRLIFAILLAFAIGKAFHRLVEMPMIKISRYVIHKMAPLFKTKPDADDSNELRKVLIVSVDNLQNGNS